VAPNEKGQESRLPLDALYITYDGLTEPVAHSQVESYLLPVARDGIRVAVLSFEKRSHYLDPQKRLEVERRLEKYGITWYPLLSHGNTPVLGPSWDLLKGMAQATRITRERRPALLHARSYMAGLVASSVKSVLPVRVLFDMRGFWPEERVELGRFRTHGFLYRMSKRCESLLLDRADHVVVLTEKAKAILRDGEASEKLKSRPVREKNISIIPCCVDLQKFRPAEKDVELSARLGLEDKLVIGNIGAVNPRYMLPEMLRFAFHVKSHRPEARFVYVTHDDAGPIRRAARDAGLENDDVVVAAAEPSEMSRWLSLFRLGVFFLQPSYAAKATSFAKLGEFLASGVPVVTNIGVGDVEDIVSQGHCGVLVPGLTDRDLAAASRQALSLLEGDEIPAELRATCRATAATHVALEEGVRRYLEIYDSMTNHRMAGAQPVMDVG
jgi:glycosyltransferase involved in cell wall biosynthesis